MQVNRRPRRTTPTAVLALILLAFGGSSAWWALHGSVPLALSGAAKAGQPAPAPVAPAVLAANAPVVSLNMPGAEASPLPGGSSLAALAPTSEAAAPATTATHPASAPLITAADVTSLMQAPLAPPVVAARAPTPAPEASRMISGTASTDEASGQAQVAPRKPAKTGPIPRTSVVAPLVVVPKRPAPERNTSQVIPPLPEKQTGTAHTGETPPLYESRLSVKAVTAPELVSIARAPVVVGAIDSKAFIKVNDLVTKAVLKGQAYPGLGVYRGLEDGAAKFDTGLFSLPNSTK